MIESSDFSRCCKKISQFENYLGIDINVVGPGEVICTLEIEKHHMAAPDACHGGVISAMMDTTLGLTSLSWSVSNGNFCSTVEFKLNYISPGRYGDRLRGTAKIDFTGSRLIVASGQIAEESSGRMIAIGMGTFSQYPISKKMDKIDLAGPGGSD